ncbi:Ig-like domain repeat protein [Thermococcus sp.]
MFKKAVVTLITLILIASALSPVIAKGVEKPERRDLFLYTYFSKVMERLDYSLRYSINNQSYGLKIVNGTLQELELLREENLYYLQKGVHTRIADILPTFYNLSREVGLLDELILEYQRNSSPLLAVGVRDAIENVRETLTEVRDLTLWNGDRALHFKTGAIEKDLSQAEALLPKEKKPRKLEIRLSTTSPILNQSVQIFGTCPGNGTVTVVIEGTETSRNLTVKPENGFFSTEYAFERIGRFTVYAVQGNETSNRVAVTVLKIPTMFITSSALSAFIGENMTLRGRLVDYMGRPLANRSITVGGKELFTSLNGSFSVVLHSDRATSFTVALRFSGDELHRGASKTLTVTFRRYPVFISLSGPQSAKPGENVTLTGKVSPAINATLDLYVNGKPAEKVNCSNGLFSFNLSSDKPGILSAYVRFGGSENLSPATSNTVRVVFKAPPDRTPKYIGIAATVLGLVLLTLSLYRRPGPEAKIMEADESEEEIEQTREEKVIPDDPARAYEMIRGELRRAFGIGLQMTPREAIKALDGWKLKGELERLTELHEKSVYAGFRLSQAEVEEMRKIVRDIMEALGDEGGS